MTGWHHRLNGDEFEQIPGDGEGQGSLACCLNNPQSRVFKPKKFKLNLSSFAVSESSASSPRSLAGWYPGIAVTKF